jgi:hypothetical protein
MRDPLNDKYLGLLLAEYARQLDEGIAAAYAGLADKQEVIGAMRVWRPFPVGPLLQDRDPTDDDPPVQWEWETPKPRILALGTLEATIERFKGLIDRIEGGQDGE